MVGTISCADFLLALKRYREEVGAPKLCRDVVGSEQMSRREHLRSVGTQRDATGNDLTDNALASVRTRQLPTTPTRKADKLKEKQLQRKAAEGQGSLW